MTRRPTAYDDALKSAFGRVRDVSPAEARDAADKFEAAGRDERAAQLREYAADLENEEDDVDERSPVKLEDDADAGDESGDEPKGKAKAKPKKRRGKVAKAARQATVGEPVDRTAVAIRGGGSVFWSMALGTVLLILLYVVVTNAGRAAQLLDTVATGATRVAYPKTAFPERYAERASAPVPQRGRIVPLTNRSRRSA